MIELKKSVYASFWQRLLAHNIDLLFLLTLFYLVSLIPYSGYDTLLFFLIYISYYSGFELSPWRATPGKKWTKLKIHNSDNRFKTFLAIFLRNSCKVISLLIFFLGFVMISFNRKKQSLHDFIAGTVVLFEEELA